MNYFISRYLGHRHNITFNVPGPLQLLTLVCDYVELLTTWDVYMTWSFTALV